MKVVQIAWKDHYSLGGWFSKEECSAVGHINYSSGFLVNQDEEHTTLAQTVHSDDTVYGDLLHILTSQIVDIQELS